MLDTRTYQELRLELELLRRRLFVAKAERIDTTQLELEFGHKLAELDALNRAMGLEPVDPAPAAGGADGGSPAGAGAGERRRNHRSTGRRDLRQEDLAVERIEVCDPDLAGKADTIDWEESNQIKWRRGGHVRVVIARAKYKPFPMVQRSAEPATSSPAATVEALPGLITAAMPPTILPRSICTPSLIAHIAVDKFCDGLPFYRQEDRSVRLGFRINRSLMSRWVEDVGMTAGATVVAAMRREALATAFCIATDATGILVQPFQSGDQVRRACSRGHYFVQIADADHVFFEYTPRETSEAVGELFDGFSGYVLADAKSVYDFLFRPPHRVLSARVREAV